MRYRSPQVFGVHRLSLAVTSLALTVFSAAAGCGLLDGQEPTASDAQEELEAKSSDAGNGPEARPAGAQKPAEDLPGLEEKKVRLELSLQVAVGIALKNNLDQRIGLLNRQIASRDVVIQRAVFDPYFNLDFTQSKNRDPTVNQLDLDPLNPITEVAVNPTNNQTYTAGIGGSTLFGTTYQLSLVENRFDSPETAVFSLNPRYSSTLRATITQPLLKNAWYAVNSANTRLAQNSLGAAGAQYTLSVMNTIYAVINAYWELVFAHRNYQAKIRASDLAQEQLRMDRQKVRVGTLPRIELTNAESQVARRKTEYDDALSLLETARDELLFQMNYTGKESLKKLWELRDENSPFDNILVVPSTEPDTVLLEPARSEAIAEAFENRPEYQQAELAIRNQEISVEVARNGLLPDLNLTGTWTQLGLDDALDSSRESLTSGKFYDWQVGISFQVQLPYRGPISAYRNARDDLRKAIYEKQKLENSIVLEVDQAIRNLLFAHRAVGNLAELVRLQEALLQAEKTKLRVGKSIAYTVSQIENDLVDVQAQELRAEADYEKAKATFHRSVGTVIEWIGGQVEE